MPSYGPPCATWPSANMAVGVFNSSARPFGLFVIMLVDNAEPGRLAFARLSLLLVASALKALINVFHGTR